MVSPVFNPPFSWPEDFLILGNSRVLKLGFVFHLMEDKKNNLDNTNTWWLLLQVVILLCSCSFRRAKLHSLIPHLKLSLKCHFLHEDYLTSQSKFTNSPSWLPPCSFCLGFLHETYHYSYQLSIFVCIIHCYISND